MIYVNGNLNTDPVPDGLTWATAFSLVQEGMDLAAGGDEVWVAAATYYENITLKNRVALYGGFAGNETSLVERNWTNNPCILDGRQTNSVVVIQFGATNLTRIDGFTIQNGRAASGGGILCSDASPVIANNLIILNSSTGISQAMGGGGIYCSKSHAAIVGNQVISNSAHLGKGVFVWRSEAVIAGNVISDNRSPPSKDSVGGGIYCGGGGGLRPNLIITSNIITRNAAFYGGGVVCDPSTFALVTDNTIAYNSAEFTGGGMDINGSAPEVSNNLFLSNSVTGQLPTRGGAILVISIYSTRIYNNLLIGNVADEGGGIYAEDGSPVIVNNTIVGNVATTGGGIANNATRPALINNLVTLNSSGIARNTIGLRNNCVFGNNGLDYEGISDQTGTNGNISMDPLLASSNDFHLAAGSPCIDAGDDSAIKPESTDLDGQVRKAGAHVDIGADEYGSSLRFSLSLLTGTTGSKFVLRLTGEAGRTYVIERGSQFTDWLPVSTNAAPAGTVDLPVTASEGPSQFYYRAVTAAP